MMRILFKENSLPKSEKELQIVFSLDASYQELFLLNNDTADISIIKRSFISYVCKI